MAVVTRVTEFVTYGIRGLGQEHGKNKTSAEECGLVTIHMKQICKIYSDLYETMRNKTSDLNGIFRTEFCPKDLFVIPRA